MNKIKFSPKDFSNRRASENIQFYNCYTKTAKMVVSKEYYAKYPENYDIPKQDICKHGNPILLNNIKSAILKRFNINNINHSPIMNYSYYQLYDSSKLYNYPTNPSVFFRKFEKDKTFEYAFWSLYDLYSKMEPDATEDEIIFRCIDRIFGDYKITGINPW